MIIELPLETWTDLLPFVPRRQLVKLLAQIADHQFAKNLQFFLTKCGKMRLDDQLKIAAAKEESAANVCGDDGNGPKRRRVVPFVSNRYWPKVQLADGPMPENINNFTIIRLRFALLLKIRIIRIPQLNSRCLIKMLYGKKSAPDKCHENEFPGTKSTRYDFFGPKSSPGKSPREDGQPRVLLLSRRWDNPIATITPFIDRIKEDFLAAKQPISFFVRIVLPKIRGQHIPSASLDNGQTMEQLVIKEAAKPNDPHWEWGSNQMVLISRYPLEAAANKYEWIEANEAEVLKWDFNEQDRRIELDDYMKATSV